MFSITSELGCMFSIISELGCMFSISQCCDAAYGYETLQTTFVYCMNKTIAVHFILINKQIIDKAEI